jgi:uncharacterized alkaline shock family protein YloU
MTKGLASISTGILARYAGDAAMEVAGVHRLARHRAVRIETDDTLVRIELHLDLVWGAEFPEVGRAVQQRVREYVGRMTDLDALRVDVVIEAIGPPS